MNRSGRERPERLRGPLGEMRDAVRRGSAGPMGAPPAGRAERLGLAAPGPAGSQAEALPSRIVQAGHRHRIGAELTGSWRGRPAVVFDLDLATNYGTRGGEGTGGVVSGRFHVAATAMRGSFGWWAVTRQDIREHLPDLGRRIRLPGPGRLERVLILSDPGTASPAPLVIEWIGREVADRRIGRYPVSVIELAGQWALAAIPVAGLEHSDENAAAQAARFGRPERGPWPEQLLGLLADLSVQLEGTSS